MSTDASKESQKQVRSAEHYDAYVNTFLGFGGADDKTSYGSFSPLLNLEYNYTQLNNMWNTSPLARHVCSIIPNDMTRKWRTMKGDGLTADQQIEFEKLEKSLKVVKCFNEAQSWANVYGNAYILIDVDDNNGGDFSKPLDISQIKQGSRLRLKALDRGTLYGIEPCLDILSENYLNFDFYTPPVNVGEEITIRIHHSRVLVFSGNKKTPYGKMTSSYFDSSVLTGLYTNLLDIDACLAAMSQGIIENNLEVVYIDSLMENTVDPTLAAATVKYAQAAAKKTSSKKPRTLDGKDKIEVLNKPMSGVVEVFKVLSESIASAQGIPFTKFLGYSPAGMNSTGESDLQIYYDKVSQAQVTEFDPHLEKLDNIMGKVLGFPDNVDYYFEWDSLEEMNDKEKSSIFKELVEAYGKLLDTGAIETSHVFTELRKAGYLTSSPDDWVEVLEKAESEVNQQLKGEFNAALGNKNVVEKEEGSSPSDNTLS